MSSLKQQQQQQSEKQIQQKLSTYKFTCYSSLLNHNLFDQSKNQIIPSSLLFPNQFYMINIIFEIFKNNNQNERVGFYQPSSFGNQLFFDFLDENLHYYIQKNVCHSDKFKESFGIIESYKIVSKEIIVTVSECYYIEGEDEMLPLQHKGTELVIDKKCIKVKLMIKNKVVNNQYRFL